MKALLDGKEIELKISEESKKELEELRKKIDPKGILKGVRSVDFSLLKQSSGKKSDIKEEQ